MSLFPSGVASHKRVGLRPAVRVVRVPHSLLSLLSFPLNSPELHSPQPLPHIPVLLGIAGEHITRSGDGQLMVEYLSLAYLFKISIHLSPLSSELHEPLGYLRATRSFTRLETLFMICLNSLSKAFHTSAIVMRFLISG